MHKTTHLIQQSKAAQGVYRKMETPDTRPGFRDQLKNPEASLTDKHCSVVTKIIIILMEFICRVFKHCFSQGPLWIHSYTRMVSLIETWQSD